MIRVHARVICGGRPDGERGFAELRRRGVKTIISVDGAEPEVDAARRFGLRYVHLPHGYDGIPPARLAELAKAVRDLDGPVYLHCHHGRHRSPAAAAAACVAAGLIAKDDAPAVLTAAGTSRDYRGLHEAVRRAAPLNSAVLDALDVEFRATVPAAPLARAMVALERTHDNLRAVAGADWSAPDHRPDLSAPHEALMLREHYTEMLRIEEVRRHPPGFREIAEDALEDAARLEQALRADGPAAHRHGEADRLLRRVTNRCVGCHRRYRDPID